MQNKCKIIDSDKRLASGKKITTHLEYLSLLLTCGSLGGVNTTTDEGWIDNARFAQVKDDLRGGEVCYGSASLICRGVISFIRCSNEYMGDHFELWAVKTS